MGDGGGGGQCFGESTNAEGDIILFRLHFLERRIIGEILGVVSMSYCKLDDILEIEPVAEGEVYCLTEYTGDWRGDDISHGDSASFEVRMVSGTDDLIFAEPLAKGLCPVKAEMSFLGDGIRGNAMG